MDSQRYRRGDQRVRPTIDGFIRPNLKKRPAQTRPISRRNNDSLRYSSTTITPPITRAKQATSQPNYRPAQTNIETAASPAAQNYTSRRQRHNPKPKKTISS